MQNDLSKKIQYAIVEIIQTIFYTASGSILLFGILEWKKQGFVTNYIHLGWLFFIAFISGVLTVVGSKKF